jgi:hypothetical protein
MIDLGDPAGPVAPNDLDVDGQSRAVDENCDGVVRRNIGADEIPTTCPTPPTQGTPPATVPLVPQAATPPPPAKKKKCKRKKKGAAAAKKCKRKK